MNWITNLFTPKIKELPPSKPTDPNHIPQLVVNQIQTPDGTFIESRSTHDYKEYTDANGFNYMVDGGLSYTRRGRDNKAPKPKECSLYTNSDFELIREEFKRGTRGEEGDQPLTYVKLKDMSNEHIWNTIAYMMNGAETIKDNPTVYAWVKYVYLKELEYRGHDTTERFGKLTKDILHAEKMFKMVRGNGSNLPRAE